jgi:Bacteriophage Mu Gam like protein
MDRELIEADLDEYEETWPEPVFDEETHVDVPERLADDKAVQGVLRRLKRLHRDQMQIIDVGSAEVARIKAWVEDRVGGIQREIDWGEKACEAYWRTHGSTKKRSLPLPDGTLKLAKTKTHVEITDLEAFMEWVIERRPPIPGTKFDFEQIRVFHPDLVRVTIEPNKTALGALEHGFEWEDDGIMHAPLSLPGGELVPGVEIQRDATDRFNVTLTDD